MNWKYHFFRLLTKGGNHCTMGVEVLNYNSILNICNGEGCRMEVRVEKDFLGEVQIPDAAYYGVQSVGRGTISRSLVIKWMKPSSVRLDM